MTQDETNTLAAALAGLRASVDHLRADIERLTRHTDKLYDSDRVLGERMATLETAARSEHARTGELAGDVKDNTVHAAIEAAIEQERQRARKATGQLVARAFAFVGLLASLVGSVVAVLALAINGG